MCDRFSRTRDGLWDLEVLILARKPKKIQDNKLKPFLHKACFGTQRAFVKSLGAN